MTYIGFPIISLIYISLFLILYFSKKRINLFENKIVIGLMFINIVGLLLELSCYAILVLFKNPDTFIGMVILKSYIAYIFLFNCVFTGYIFVITNKNYSDNTYDMKGYFNRTLLIFFPLTLVLIIATYIFPLNYYAAYPKFYTYGNATTMLFYSFGVLLPIWTTKCIISLFKGEKKINSRVFLLLLGIILVSTAGALTQFVDRSILIITSAHSLALTFIYFTIENPDMKMVQELEVAREQADKANSAKTDFLSSMSHEIRTPLNAIVGFSDCIMDAESLGEAKENAKDIVNASQTLLEIVNGILDISKIEAGKIEIVNSKYDAHETFEELAKLITPRMNEKGLDFTYSIAPDLPATLLGDHANLKKIVTNLLSNACKYTDKGFVHYEVNCINTHNVSKLIISVEDSGRGIKKDSVDKMFTRFQRLEEDRNTTIEGTGLGLAITKQLIELMGGRIILHTVYGQGSKFTVVLNQKITTADSESAKKVKTTLDLTNVKLMLVDDTPLNLKVACKLLERYGANQIVTCNSGFECLDRIKRGEVYDLILLDDMMPKMSGVETLQQLKQIPGFKVPTVALTANAISGMREKYLADGFDDFLAKPIEKDQMIQVINQLLGRSITEDIQISKKDITNVNVETPNIREHVIPNVEDISKNVEAKKKAEEEAKQNPDIIPVEDNIEEILGSQLDMNYKEHQTMTNLKPIEADKIEEVELLDEPVLTPVEPIQQVEPIQTIPVQQVEPIQVAPIENTSYDRSYLESHGADINHALELLGDMDMYNMTINDFMKEVENKWNRIVEYKNSNNMPDYAIEVHSLKSDCKYLGFMSLADVAYEHELKSKEGDSNFVNSNFARLEEEYKKVLEVARTYVEHNPVES